MSEEEKDAYEKSPIPRKACVRSRAAALRRDRPRHWSLILSLIGCLHVSETLLTRADAAAVVAAAIGQNGIHASVTRQANAQQ
jgi:hypothetical protein